MNILNMEPLPKVQIVKHDVPMGVKVNEIKIWNMWVTEETKYIQLVYYVQHDYTDTGPYWEQVYSSDIIELSENDYVMDKEYKKISARFGPLKWTGDYRIEIRAWNDYGIWDNNQKDRQVVYTTVEYGVGHGIH